MQFLAAFLFTVLIYSLVCPFKVQANLLADCTFEEVQSRTSGQNMSALSMKFSGQLPSTRNMSHSCVVKTDNRNSLLYLRAKRNKESKGALHVSVYGTDESFWGHLDISQSTDGWSSLLLSCPCPSATEVSEKYLTFSGTSGLIFTVEFAQVEDVKLDEPTKPFTLSSKSPVQVFQFNPTEDISQTQLDVTVRSTSDVPAYLKVSRDCKDVEDNIEHVDYKGESIRLSFAKKGRITLSKFSTPPLTDSTSSWFIGIKIKNATGDTPFEATKVVILELAKSFDYSYDRPLLILSLVIAVFCGIAIASWALYCFKEPHVKPSELFCPAQGKLEALPLLTEGQNTNSIRISWKELRQAMWEVMCNHLFKRSPTGTYSYITCIVGSVFMVGAFQFVFADWYLMIQEGDRDHCYYNDFCYRVMYRDIPFNLMMSNLPYVLHGIMLAVTVWYMEGELLARCKQLAKRYHPPPAAPYGYDGLPNHLLKCPNIVPHLAKMNVPQFEINKLDEKAKQLLYAEAHKNKFTFSIGYAFAVGLIFEGLFSSLYHLCPSKLTFQFDTAFMFVIAGLIVVILYNGIEMSECPARGEGKRLVGAGNFFLYFVVPLYIFNYFGSMYHSEAGLIKMVEIPFFIFLAFWCLFMVGWAGYKVFPKECSKTCIGKSKAKLFAFLVSVGVPIFCMVVWRNNLPEAFLFTCIIESIIVIFCKVAKKIWNYCKGCRHSTKQNATKRNYILLISQVLYVLATLAVGITAVVFFVVKPTTDKVKSAENSRDLNEECYWLGFFDHHDIWHILSSLTLLMGAHLVMYISYDHPVNENGKGLGRQISRRVSI